MQRENEQPSASDQQQVAADVGFAQPLKTVLGASCVHLLSDVDRLLLQLKFVLERPFDLCSGKQVAFKEARRRSLCRVDESTLRFVHMKSKRRKKRRWKGFFS